MIVKKKLLSLVAAGLALASTTTHAELLMGAGAAAYHLPHTGLGTAKQQAGLPGGINLRGEGQCVHAIPYKRVLVAACRC